MRCWIICLPVLAASAQPQSLIDRVKARAQENFTQLPDYTCTEHMQRWLHAPRERRFRAMPTVNLNVAYVGGKELFGLPGTGRVDQPDFHKLVSGPPGSGEFAIYVRSIFVENRASFGEPNKTKLDGRPAFRFEYSVPLARSGYLFRSSAGTAVAGYRGNFWVSRDSLDLMRLEVIADELPPALEMKSIASVIDYGDVGIAGRGFLLPVRSTYTDKDVFGAEDRGLTTFERCRRYVGESILKFEGTPPSAPSK